MENSLPLNLCHVQKSSVMVNRSHILLHSISLMALIVYRTSFLFQNTKITDEHILIPWFMVFVSELILSFIWLLTQAYRWRPVSRTVFPERLPEDIELPPIDVFISTVDPDKEPTLGVMNTVLSAMALDYPPDKLSVYLSDDGGSTVTLHATREAWKFARYWLLFCRKYGLKTSCPQAYFSAADDDHAEFRSSEFTAEKNKIKEKYEVFKEGVMKIREKASIVVSRDHPPAVEVIRDAMGVDQAEIPLLVYVSREKRPSHPHRFKAGALNVLLRVSGMISNSSYILVLDCDMYCNDPTSARQAMCFHLDPNISHSLAFVQFPQKFHNISENDIYDSQHRFAEKIILPGFDGHQGPFLAGTGFYIKREALYGNSVLDGADLTELKQCFGPSNEFIGSVRRNYKPNITSSRDIPSSLLQETQLLASCAYEEHTKWGKEVGFWYFSVTEDIITGLNLHCKGWISVYYAPQRPSFLGTATTNLNDLLAQGTRWSSGWVEIGISRFCPLIYGPLRMSILESMCYGEVTFAPFYFFPLWCLATIPQLCLLNGIPLYPKVSDWFFIIFLFIFLSSNFKHIQEILSTGGSIRSWRNEQRIWMIRSITCHLYGSLNAIMERIGIREVSFLPTNKVDDDEQVKQYQRGAFDFQTSTMFLVPLCTLVILNVASLVLGVLRVIVTGRFNEMIIQIFLSFFIATLSYPITEGMIFRKDKGRVPLSVTFLSVVIATVFLSLGSSVLIY